MRNHLIHALGLGLLLAAATIGLLFGAEMARFAHMTQALADMEECLDIPDAGASANCVDSAYDRLKLAKGGR